SGCVPAHLPTGPPAAYLAPAMTTDPCPRCGAPASGKFCSSCGAPLGATSCTGCRAELTPGARFCHRCGRGVGAGSAEGMGGKAPWIVAAVVSLTLVGWVIWRVNRGVEVAPPPAGRSSGANAPFASGGSGTPPDLSSMTPKDAFLRLHDRVMG